MGDQVRLSGRARYDYLGQLDKAKAQNYFRTLAAKEPHNAWMEDRFLEMLTQVNTQTLASAYKAEDIKPADVTDPKLFAKYSDLSSEQARLQKIGMQVLADGELLIIDLAAGMGTGFGGTAKASVAAIRDERYRVSRDVTYLDIKREDYLYYQRKVKKHLIAAEMVSDATEKDVLKSLHEFADRNKIELVIIPPGASSAEIELIWKEKETKWNECIIVPLIKQPATLEICEDGKSVGGEYMKGHGDYFDVVKNQLKDICKVMKIKYVFSQNIDNTGAWISRSIIGYFVEQVQQQKIEAMMELAEKFEGDKGGAPAIIHGKLGVLEGAFVPKDWKQAFMGRVVFPYMNTNSLWWTVDALMNTAFDLPLMLTKTTEKGMLKIESIMCHGLNSLKFMSLVVDRGVRFQPAKFLSDLWIGRTDYIVKHDGKTMTCMSNGEVVAKPVLGISKSIIASVSDLNDNVFAGGSCDSMKRLDNLVVGGEGDFFHDRSNKMVFKTNCAVTYEGSVVVIYEHKEGKAPGSLVIEGANQRDEIKLKNCIIYVPAGKTKEVNASLIDEMDTKVTKEGLITTLANIENWTEERKQQLVDKFFPEEEKLPSFEQIVTKDIVNRLSAISKEHVEALKHVFKLSGTFTYQARTEGDRVLIKVIEKSKRGSAAREYVSKAETREVVASPQKQIAINGADRVVISVKGDGLASIAVPVIDGGSKKLMNLLGEFNEDYPSDKKTELLKGKFEEVIRVIAQKMEGSDETVVAGMFCAFTWAVLMESTPDQIANMILQHISA